MKGSLLIIAMLLTGLLFAQTEKKPYDGNKVYSSKADKKKFYDQLSTKYCSADVQKVWKSDANAQEFMQWVDGSTETELVAEFCTVIHELTHGMDNHENNGRNFYVNKDITIFVPITDIYLSTDLNKVVRKGQQDSVFRYGLYIGGKNVLPDGSKTTEINTSANNQPSSIQEGIYGLMGEFDAYYYDTRTTYELYEYYADKNWKDDLEMFRSFKHDVLGQGVAYYEFRLFMGWYLVHASKKHPEKYKTIMANKPLRVLYTLMSDNFSSLLNSVDSLVQKVESELPADTPSDGMMGLKFDGSDEDKIKFLGLVGLSEDMGIYKVEKKTVGGKETVKLKILDKENYEVVEKSYIDMQKELKAMTSNKDGVSTDIMLFYADPSQQIHYLKKQFTKEVNAELEKLRIDGVTEKNYKEYLK